MGWKANVKLHGPLWAFLIALLCASGCATERSYGIPAVEAMPRELEKITIPQYTISPPDVLLVDVIRLIPRPPYKVAPLDSLLIQVELSLASRDPVTIDPVQEPARYKEETEKNRHLRRGQPIEAIFRVEPDGRIDLGWEYGYVQVVGLTIPEVKAAIRTHLQQTFSKVQFDVRVALAESQALQQIRGDHLVRPDGTVALGSYGSVNVNHLTADQAKMAIQEMLSAKFLDPVISLQVSGYNSMVYYVIFDLDVAGQSVKRMPFTGNETVLDAIGDMNGLPPGVDRFRMWIARPTLAEKGPEQVLPVDWQAITRRGLASTNYQLLPGDRLYVAVDPLVQADGVLAKVIAPIERVLGIILLGNSSVQSFRNNGNGIGGGT